MNRARLGGSRRLDRQCSTCEKRGLYCFCAHIHCDEIDDLRRQNRRLVRLVRQGLENLWSSTMDDRLRWELHAVRLVGKPSWMVATARAQRPR